MSIKSVQSQIKQAAANGRITQPEARAIIKEAEKGPLTIGEAKLIADAYEAPRRMHTMAVGEGPEYVTTPAADKAFEKFFERAGLPVGEAGQAVLGHMASLIAFRRQTGSLGTFGLASPPANVEKMVSASLEGGPVGGPYKQVHVDAGKREFYYSEQAMIFPQPAAKFFGPFSVDAPIPAISLPGMGTPGGRPIGG
jgi:hypothetical protein